MLIHPAVSSQMSQTLRLIPLFHPKKEWPNEKLIQVFYTHTSLFPLVSEKRSCRMKSRKAICLVYAPCSFICNSPYIPFKLSRCRGIRVQKKWSLGLWAKARSPFNNSGHNDEQRGWHMSSNCSNQNETQGFG